MQVTKEPAAKISKATKRQDTDITEKTKALPDTVVVTGGEDKSKRKKDVELTASQTCRMTACTRPAQAHSIYCSDGCIRRHCAESLALLNRDVGQDGPRLVRMNTFSLLVG